MPIAVEIQDENGRRLADPWWHPRSTELLCSNLSAPGYLSGIDPYGDTTFNQLQLPLVLNEIRAMRAASTEPAAAEVLDQLLAYLAGAIDRTHVYVKFIGD